MIDESSSPALYGNPPAALDALFVPFENGALMFPAGDALFLNARSCPQMRTAPHTRWSCEQDFKPFADVLRRDGFELRDKAEIRATPAQEFPLVMVLPTRQRDAARAMYARALMQAGEAGVVIASVANNEGARSSEADLRRLAGAVQTQSKHKCRVFWTKRSDTGIDRELLAEWLALDEPQPIEGSNLVSRPGLFAWNRIDPASELLAAQLPRTLSGTAADLGAGFGYLATEVLRRCEGVDRIDLYEADARALEPARINTAHVAAECGRETVIEVIWHDVAAGLPRKYDVIVSNPPFHQGRADLPQLGRAFIASAAAALAPGGSFWMVANRQLPYEAELASRFGEVQTRIENGGFKVFEARAARQ